MNLNRDISIVIVSYNSAFFLRNCLSSLREASPGLNKEVIVVDNASSDDSQEIIQREFPEVILIANKENVGFARANNIGWKYSHGRYVLFLNPDTVLKAAALQRMFSFMESHPEAGALGPRLVYPDGSLQFSCRRFYNVRTIIFRRTFLGKIFPDSRTLKSHLMADWAHDSVQVVDWVLAAAFFVRREILEKIGGFDEKYKLYFEDVDLCCRIKNYGYKIYYYPEAEIVHHHQRESAQKFSRKTLWHILSAVRFFNKFGWKL